MREGYKNNFLMKDMLLIYRNKCNVSLKIEYDCFDKKYIDEDGKVLSDTIYKRYPIPRDYFGVIVSFKKDIDKNNFYYEYEGVNKGKIRTYKYEIYELNEKDKVFNTIYNDINELFINKLEIKDNDEDIKYKSFYKKQNYGRVIIEGDFNKIIFKNEKSTINIKRFIKTILDYEGFLIRIQIIKSNN